MPITAPKGLTDYGTMIALEQLVEQINSEGVGGGLPSAVSSLTPIADPSTATAEDVANKVNAVIAALQS